MATKSKALRRSIIPTPVKRPLSIASSHSSVILIRVVSQEWLALKPDWHFVNRD